MEEKVAFDGKKVKVLGPTFEEGKAETPINWRQKLRNREEMLGLSQDRGALLVQRGMVRQ